MVLAAVKQYDRALRLASEALKGDAEVVLAAVKQNGEALKHADPDWRPIIPVWGKINADLGTTLSKVLTEGLDVQDALDGVAERTRGVMEEAGYYTWQ